MRPLLNGILASLVTPFFPDGSIDWEGLGRETHYLNNSPVHGICIGGVLSGMAGAAPQEDDVADVRAMCAIGMRGQLGLNGRLPWEGNKGREYVADVARFFDVTRGHVIIAGPRTVASIPAFAYEERTICEIRSENHPADVLAWFPDRVVYVGGGPPVWETYAPFIRHWDITRLPYDGEADRWFDPAWLVAAEKPE